MARKRSTRNPHPTLSSEDEEDDGEASERNDDVKEEESPVKKPFVVHKHHSSSDSEDDTENTIPSPNVSDFTIKPITNTSSDTPTNRPGSKRPAYSEPAAATEPKKQKNQADEEGPSIVLGLPSQTASGKISKSVSRSEAKPKVRKEVIVNSQRRLDESLEFDMGKEKMDGKSKRLLERMLEIYIKRTELVQEQTQLILNELKSEKI